MLGLQTGGGFASVSYNLGGQTFSVGDVVHPVNDGKYHVIRFKRNAANASFQLDAFPLQTEAPRGFRLLA